MEDSCKLSHHIILISNRFGQQSQYNTIKILTKNKP